LWLDCFGGSRKGIEKMATYPAVRGLRALVGAAGLVLMVLAVWILAAGVGHAQYSGRRVPTVQYQGTFRLLSDGEYRQALRSFSSEGRGAIKSPTSRWLDSICYEAMVGECLYEMGQLPEALEHYTAAVRLYLSYSDWLAHVQFPAAALQPARQTNTRHRATWGPGKRASQPANLPETMLIGQGQLNAGQVVRQGGVFTPPQLMSIDAVEIVRATTLAIRRRTELLGPTSKYDPVTGELLAALAARPALPNHWSECWVDVELGLAQVAAGKEEQGRKSLERGLLAAGQFDHPMTAVALFELGRLAMGRGDLKSAGDFFLESTFVAAWYGDVRLVEEAFRHATAVHLVTSPGSVYGPLAEALAWAKRNRFRELACSLVISLAENHAAMGQTAAAATELGEATKWFVQRDMAAARLGARHAFVGARVAYQQGNVAAGNAAVGRAMEYQHHGSHWLFHTVLVDQLCVGGAITPRTAMDLYAAVLRDPRAEDWSFRPEESLATLVTPHFAPLEHWFEVALARKDQEAALEISDRVRRHRFYSTLPFGGRVESFRWLLEGPEEALDRPAQLQRRDLRASRPAYDKLSKEAAALRAALRQGPVVPDDARAAAAQQKQLAELAARCASQEVLLREIAVSRQPAELVFPPLRATAEVQKALPDGTALLAFFVTQRGVYAFLLNNARYDYWLLDSPVAIKRKLVATLRAMGQFDANREIAIDDLADTRWQRSASELLGAVLAGSQADFTSHFDELVIVPDGLFWYVPFEALQVTVDGQSEPLIARFRIRYAPTVGLAVPDGRRRKNVVRTGVVVGRLFPRDEDEVAREALDKLAKVVPGATALPGGLPAGSAVYRTLLDQLIVYNDVAAGRSGAYAWQPIPAERPKAGSTLADWLALPWGGPETIMLPGFHTAAENGLKSSGPNGNEMFLSVCGLMASGARTVLLSRWRTGGETSFALTREFAQELPHASPAEAWQRAVLVVHDSRMEPDKEPRVKSPSKPDGEAPKVEHPFFWAGYMLVDPGGTR